MNDETIADFKQFIAATVKQEVSGVEQRLGERIDRLDAKVGNVEFRLNARIDTIESRLNSKIDGVEQRLTTKLDEIQGSIGEAITTANDADQPMLQDHERRLRRLEHRAA